jgi:hypothetical protein
MEVITGIAVVAVALGYFAIKAQLDPIALCEDCNGRPPGDGKGHFHDCPTCGGSPRRLRFGAWVQIKMGIPVPRTKKSTKRHRMSP